MNATQELLERFERMQYRRACQRLAEGLSPAHLRRRSADKGFAREPVNFAHISIRPGLQWNCAGRCRQNLLPIRR